MRKLESSLASLRSAARERAAQRRPQGDGQIGPANDSEALVAAPKAARFGFLNRAVARLRAIGRRLLGTRLR
jgi:hypothetical protein